jgi:D-alanine-D-alanine ligase
VGIVGEEVNSLIEIVPTVEFYDYQAKYEREDTRYNVNPNLPDGLAEALCDASIRLFRVMGCKDLARIDFRFDDTNSNRDHMQAWSFLEINTIPGFTSHSLVPMGARHMRGWSMSDLCIRLVRLAFLRGGTQSATSSPTSARPDAPSSGSGSRVSSAPIPTA